MGACPGDCEKLPTGQCFLYMVNLVRVIIYYEPSGCGTQSKIQPGSIVYSRYGSSKPLNSIPTQPSRAGTTTRTKQTRGRLWATTDSRYHSCIHAKYSNGILSSSTQTRQRPGRTQHITVELACPRVHAGSGHQTCRTTL